MAVAAGSSLQAGSYMAGCVVHDSPSGGLAVQGNMQVQLPAQAATPLQYVTPRQMLPAAWAMLVKHLPSTCASVHMGLTMSGLLLKGAASLTTFEGVLLSAEEWQPAGDVRSGAQHHWAWSSSEQR